jgi:hypothetical protein
VSSAVLKPFGTSGVLIAWVNAVSECVRHESGGRNPGFEQPVEKA